MLILRPFLWVFHPIRLFFKNRRLQTSRQLVATYRCSANKPPVLQARSFELFYRPRFWLSAAQVVALTALALWTVRNYIHVLHSM